MARGAEPKRIFVAATKQDQGKTTVSLGLMAALEDRALAVGFMKPVGQRYVEIEGERVDEDVALMRAIFPSEAGLKDMNPVTVGRSFTREYIRAPDPEALCRRIDESFRRIAAGRQAVVIEGTGHAGVGSCFDASNAAVARRLGAKALLVASGGIGRPIDEVMLNRALFADSGVELLGVVLNKVLPEKLADIREVVRLGLARKGIELLGCMPSEPLLANPSMRQIHEELGGELLNGAAALDHSVETVIVGAMAAHRALEYVRPHCLLITPGDRDDLILAVMGTFGVPAGDAAGVAGMLLTGGRPPQKNTMDLIQRTDVPVILFGGDSYSVAAAVNHLKVKIQPADAPKIAAACRLVREHVDHEKIVRRL
jgi:hypothetical protein